MEAMKFDSFNSLNWSSFLFCSYAWKSNSCWTLWRRAWPSFCLFCASI